MRNIVLLNYNKDLMYVVYDGKMTKESIYDKRFDEIDERDKTYGTVDGLFLAVVSTYDQLYNEVMRRFVQDKDKWLSEIKMKLNTDNEEEVKKSILKGSFDSDIFMVDIAEDSKVVCMIRDEYEKVSYLWANKLGDHIKNLITTYN